MINFIIGPQLMGIIFLIAGFISAKFPPKKINHFYGYRTASSMKNQETWDEANRFSSRYMMRLGLILVIAGLMISAIFGAGMISSKFINVLRPLLLISTSIGSAVVLIVTTERHLTKTFDQDKG